ncbi:hypothetical protein K488DRAFT_85552 [Vararia minispora EC-137]|uniref:Uncharacterized protein n=1 Tax=Vararia minispora EC-137 TaxID=1314806 RepID=A0ACB8QLL1_9AGAM|nr:hypothetical protein K488DRAFT_85552 [Vararia minispora EC-137]
MAADESKGESHPHHTYHTKSFIRNGAVVGSQGAGIGTFISVVQNALSKHKEGAWGFATRYGSTIGILGAMGFTFAATEAIVANTREKEDSLNAAAGACAAGFLVGLRHGSLPVGAASCALMGVSVGTFDYAGKLLTGDPSLTYEERRKRFFKQQPSAPPLEES